MVSRRRLKAVLASDCSAGEDGSGRGIPLWDKHVISINPADIEAGYYLTWSQALRRIQDRLYFNRAQSRTFIAFARCRGCLSCVWWDEYLEHHPDLPMREWRSDHPPTDSQYWETVACDPCDPDQLREPIYDYRMTDDTSIVARREDECRYRRPVFLCKPLEEYIDEFRATHFTPATETDIRRALDVVYDNAAANDLSPPNVLRAARAAKEHLSGGLISASENQIRPIAGEDCYRRRRAKPGPRVQQNTDLKSFSAGHAERN